MERPRSLAGVYLGMFYGFTVFMSVSSVAFHNPRLYIQEIHNLLGNLSKELKGENLGDNREICPTNTDMEYEHDCVGTFLDMFLNGTKSIGKKFGSISNVHNITLDIDGCVTQLRRDCKKLKKEHNAMCTENTTKKKILEFVERFQTFSDCDSGLMKVCCKKSLSQEHEDSEEYDPVKDLPICGRR
ncbi:uncharacterized protein ACMZJ9_013052 [Mantella aurantiaca]